MTLKKILFIICGIIICGLGIVLLTYGYGIYKKEAFNFNFLTLLIFMQIAPEFNINIDFSLFPELYIYYYIYILDFLSIIYIMIVELIQIILQPYLITIFYPIMGLIAITIGSVFITLGVIYYQRQYSNVQ